MKRALSIALVAALCLAALAGCGSSASSSAAPQPSGESAPVESSAPGEGSSEVELNIPSQQLTIGTASAGGAYYPIGTGLAEVITQHVEPLNVTAEITGGGVENVRLVGEGETDLAISNSDSVMFGLEGAEPYTQAYDVTPICSLHSSVLHIVTLEGTGVTSVADLKGQKVAVGPAGGGSIAGITVVLQAYGMTMDDIIPSYVSYEDGMSQLKDGQVKAALAMSGYPASSVLALGATDQVVMVNIPEDKMAEIQEIAPYYSPVTIAADVYGLTEDASVIGVKNIVYCSSALDEDTVYAITKAIYENLDELKTFHSALENVTQADLPDVGAYDLHPGAARYYQEIGVL